MLVSLLGHFSFIVFAGYLLVIFPLTFVVMSQRLLRFISAALATAGLTLLLVDSEVFSHFHLHLNPVVWDLVVNPDQSELSRDWQLMFICVPVLFTVEMLFGTELAKAAQPEPPPFRQAAGGAVYQRLFRFAPDLYLGRRQLLSPDHHAAGQPAALVPDDRAQVPRKTRPARPARV